MSHGVLRLLILGGAVALSLPVRAAEEPDLGPVATRIVEELGRVGKKSVAVGEAYPITQPTALGAYLAEELTVALVRHGGVEVAREHLGTAITPRDLARRLGVDAVVDPAYTTFRDQVRLSVKIVDGGNGRIVAAFAIDLPRSARIDELEPPPAARAAAAALPPPPASTTGATTVGVGPLTLGVHSCQAYKDAVTCSGQVINPTAERFGLECARGDVYFVDDQGGQSGLNTFALGSSGYSQWIEPSMGLRWTLKGSGITPTSTTGTVVLRCAIRDQTKARGDWQAITVRGVQLNRQ